MAFNATVDGFGLPMDAAPESGGDDYGPRPKTLVLTALCGCTAMDVLAIIRKMRLPLEGLKVSAAGTLSQTHPKVFTAITLRYDFTGSNLPIANLERAVILSLDRYCGVAAMLRATVEITHEIHCHPSQHSLGDVAFQTSADVAEEESQ